MSKRHARTGGKLWIVLSRHGGEEEGRGGRTAGADVLRFWARHDSDEM